MRNGTLESTVINSCANIVCIYMPAKRFATGSHVRICIVLPKSSFVRFCLGSSVACSIDSVVCDVYGQAVSFSGHRMKPVLF